jgi:hypothetical protein
MVAMSEAIAVGAAIFVDMANRFHGHGDGVHVAAYGVSDIGFLNAGVIIARKITYAGSTPPPLCGVSSGGCLRRGCLPNIKGIRIFWGVDRYPQGADWERGIYRVPIAVVISFGEKDLLEVVWVILGVERVEYTHYCRLSCIPRGR